MKDYNAVDISELNQDMKVFFHAKEFDLVKYLLISPELKHHADINYEFDYIFEHACSGGHLEFIKFIMDTPSLNRNISPLKSCNKGINLTARSDHLECLQYFESKHKEIDTNIDYYPGMLQALALCKLNTFQYLINKYLENNKLDEEIYDLFSQIFKTNQLDLIQYMIFDLNIPKTDYIEGMLENNPLKEQVNNLFSLRELNKNLNSELPNTQSINKKPKI
jgi:hypothetical protein